MARFTTAGMDRLHAAMAGFVERGEIPGIVTLLASDGEVDVGAFGTLATDRAVAVRRDSIFRIASMTKPVVAAAAMMLVEECRLRLDDPVDDLLPELANRQVLRTLGSELDDTVPARRSITLRDLLTFRMGFGQLLAPPDAYPILKAADGLKIGVGPPDPDGIPAPEEWLRRLGSLPLMCQPGERWLYNTGSDVLGVLIARAAGQPLEVFLRERIFEPLGMKDTGFMVPPDKLERFATAYWTNLETGGVEVFDEREGAWSRPPAFPSGAGGLVSTVDDYAAFGQMMLDGGTYQGRRLLSRRTVELMATDQLTPSQKAGSGFDPEYFDDHGWGLGMAVVTRRANIAQNPGTFGWDGGLGTSWFSDPSERLQGILLTQQAWKSPSPPEVVRDFQTLSYLALEE